MSAITEGNEMLPGLVRQWSEVAMRSSCWVKRRRRLGICLLLAGVNLGAACRFLNSEQSPTAQASRSRPGSRPYQDEHLARLLEPDLPIETAGLYVDSKRFVSYEARFSEDAPRGYRDRYLGLLLSRGVLVQPIGSSPHAIPPRVLGYTALALRPGRKDPFSLFYVSYWNKDDDWLERHFLRSAPEPIRIEGRALWLDLGKPEGDWREEIMVPNEDLVQVKELPFARFPGAVLKTAFGAANDSALRSDQHINRSYVVRHVEMEQLLEHYRRELARLGIGADATGSVSWAGPPVEGMESISIRRDGIGLPSSANLSPSDMAKQAPGLLEGYPVDAIEIGLYVRFASVDEAVQYWPERDQRRREALLKREETR